MSTIRYFAAVKEAAGVGEEVVEAATLAAALAAVRELHPGRFAAVLAGCSFVIDGAPVGSRDHAVVPLRPDSVIDALPPFAGG